MSKPAEPDQNDAPVSQHVMSAKSVVQLLELLGSRGVDTCVRGGWAVDALLGEQTREHSDLDLWLSAVDLAGLVVAFAEAGIDRIMPWGDDRPWNFVLHDGASRRVDLHLYEFLGNGSVHYGSVTQGVRFPAEALHARGVIGGIRVRCESPEWVIRWHTGYPLRPVDRHDAAVICARFDIALPDEYR